MKKIIASIIMSILIFGLAGCASGSKQPEQAPAPKQQTSKNDYPFPKDSAPKGKALLVITTSNGDSSHGKVPYLEVKKNDIVEQLGTYYKNFDGKLVTFVYINKKFVTIEQISGGDSSYVNLSKEQLKPGEYTMTAVQFKHNDPKEAVVNLAQAKYRMKAAQ